MDNRRFKVEYMFDEEWQSVLLANKPTQILYLRIPFAVKEGYMIRKVSRI